MSAYRPEFEAALRRFARGSEAMTARGFERPMLVGGSAVEYYTATAIATGDFDIVTGRQDVFEEELQKLGFVELFDLYPGADMAYMEQPIRRESAGDLGVDDLVR